VGKGRVELDAAVYSRGTVRRNGGAIRNAPSFVYRHRGASEGRITPLGSSHAGVVAEFDL
jgi:hypothetical protein